MNALRFLGPAAALALALTLPGCTSRSTRYLSAPFVPPPGGIPNTPAHAVERLAWSLVNRDPASYVALLTDDYVFQFALNDSAGNPYPGRRLDRTQDGISMLHLLSGGGSLPPASDIALMIDNPLVAQPDPRPDRDPRWFRVVRTSLACKITLANNGSPDVSSVTGYALFYLVRGDSAFFLPGHAAMRDSTRWYVSRWEDETAGYAGVPGLHTDPVPIMTFGLIKGLYLSPAAPAK